MLSPRIKGVIAGLKMSYFVSSFCSFVHSLIHSFVYIVSFVVHSLIQSVAHENSSANSFIYSFFCSFVRSIDYLFHLKLLVPQYLLLCRLPGASSRMRLTTRNKWSLSRIQSSGSTFFALIFGLQHRIICKNEQCTTISFTFIVMYSKHSKADTSPRRTENLVSAEFPLFLCKPLWL